MAGKSGSATDLPGLVVREHRYCEEEDLQEARKSAGSLLVRFASYDRDEKQRMSQRTAVAVKAALDAKLKGNWNVLIGSDMQVSVGLLPDCRLIRLECLQERLFCFETHTHLFDPSKQEDQKPTNLAGASQTGQAEDKQQAAGQPQNKQAQLAKIAENPEETKNAQKKPNTQAPSQQQLPQPKPHTQTDKPTINDKASDLASNKQSNKTPSDQPADSASLSKPSTDKPPAEKNGETDLSKPKDSSKLPPANAKANK